MKLCFYSRLTKEGSLPSTVLLLLHFSNSKTDKRPIYSSSTGSTTPVVGGGGNIIHADTNASHQKSKRPVSYFAPSPPPHKPPTYGVSTLPHYEHRTFNKPPSTIAQDRCPPAARYDAPAAAPPPACSTLLLRSRLEVAVLDVPRSTVGSASPIWPGTCPLECHVSCPVAP